MRDTNGTTIPRHGSMRNAMATLVGSDDVGRILLDTTVLIDYLRGRPGTTSRVDQLEPRGDVAYVCAINIEEVSRGIRASDEDAFLALLEGVEVARLGVPEGRLAGFWRRTLARRGRTLGQSDALI